MELMFIYFETLVSDDTGCVSNLSLTSFSAAAAMAHGQVFQAAAEL